MKASSKSFSKNVSIAEGAQGGEESSKKRRSTACPNISPETNKFIGNGSNGQIASNLFQSILISQGYIITPRSSYNFHAANQTIDKLYRISVFPSI